MFSRDEIKSNLLGCFEVFLFMRRGMDRFVVSPGAAVKSFVIPIVCLPLTLVVMIGMSQAGMPAVWVFAHVVRMVLSLTLYLLAVYYLVKQYGLEGYFYQFLVAINWMNISGLVFVLPIVGGLLMGADMSSFESYTIFITLASYVYLAFVVTHCFRMPWEMGGFIAIVGMAIDQELLRFLEHVQAVSV